MLLTAAPALAYPQEPAAPAAPGSAAQPVIVPVPPPRPVSGFVVDARGVLAKFGQRPETADAFGVNPEDVPGPGLGLSAGVHLYPLRLGRVALGVGGEIVLARRGRQPIDGSGNPDGPALTSRLLSFSPQVSANFGDRDGWSYVSAGMGTASFETFASDGENPDRRVRAINYGGGARWFVSSHLAFTIDLRFYAVSPALADQANPIARPRASLMVLSAGISAR